MGTKNNPGQYDCYDTAEPDEPMFILIARDPNARRLVDRWATLSEVEGGNPDKIAEARQCAIDMEAWRVDKVLSDEEKAVAMDTVLEADTVQQLAEPPPEGDNEEVAKSPTEDTPA